MYSLRLTKAMTGLYIDFSFQETKSVSNCVGTSRLKNNLQLHTQLNIYKHKFTKLKLMTIFFLIWLIIGFTELQKEHIRLGVGPGGGLKNIRIVRLNFLQVCGFKETSPRILFCFEEIKKKSCWFYLESFTLKEVNINVCRLLEM